MNNVEKGGRRLIFAEEMFCPHPLKRLRVDMKRLHPTDHEEARPKKFPKKSLVEEVVDQRDEEGGTEEGVKKKDLEGLSKADQKGVGGEEDNDPVSGDGENNNVQYVEGRSPLWSSRKVSGSENGVTIGDPRTPRRSRRVSGSQAVIIRPRRFSGDPSSEGSSVNENQRQRRCSVGESKMTKSTIDTPRRGVRSKRSLGDPAKACEEVVKLGRGPKTSHKPLGRPPKVTRHSLHEEHNTLVSRLRRGLENPRNEDGVEDMQNNNALRVKVEKSPYSCKVCGKEFTQASFLMEHNKDPKAHKRPYACSLSHCSRTFAQLEHLLNHKTRVHDDPRVEHQVEHQCQNCHLQFSSPGALAFHCDLKYCNPPKQRSYLTSQTPSNCKAKFSNGKLLQLHLKLRHQEDPPDLGSFVSLQETSEEIMSKCSVPGCLEKFSDMVELQEHEDCCRKQKQVTCRNCRKEFETPLDMLLHRISCEQKVDDGTKCNTQPSCPNCSRKFKGDRFLQNHMKRSSCKEAFKTFICDSSNCGKMFEKPVLLRNHLYSHTDAPFHCSREHCGLSFVLLDNYRDHCKLKHDGELRLLNCDRCNDVFTLQSHLEAHKESIHKEVSYDLSIFEDLEQEELSCPFCDEKFETVSVMRVHLVGRHLPPWTCQGCGEELLSLKQTRHHFLNCKLRVVATSNMRKDANNSKDIDETESKDKNVNLTHQSLHCDATQEESLDAPHQNNFTRSLDNSTESLSETLNETTVSSENIPTEVKKDVIVKDDSLEIIDHLVEEKHKAKIFVEKLAEGLEDTADFEDDAVAVTDEGLANNAKSFNSRDDEDDENDAVEVTDNHSQCGNERNTSELHRSEEDIPKELEAQQEVEENGRECSLDCANNFEKELSEGVVIPNTSDFHHDDIALSNDVGESGQVHHPTEPEVRGAEVVEREMEGERLQNSNSLEPAEAFERRKEAERLHLEVVNQPGCPTTGDFAKTFGISANSIQLNVIPELLEPCEGCYPTSLTNGLAIDLLEVSSARGILMEKLVTFLQQLVLPGGVAGEADGVVGEVQGVAVEADICKKEVAAVVARLSRVRVQAARFRARYSQLPHYLDDYLTKYFNPFM